MAAFVLKKPMPAKFQICLLLLLNINCLAQRTDPNSQAIELGKVEWYKTYDKALELSKETGKPILILFQEVPGCSTCQNYGFNVLSHPLIVDAIENEFIALAIFNNKKGEDARVLKLFNEPSWNNPVIRIIDSNAKDIISRINGQYDAESLVLNMIIALRKAHRKIPEYLNLLNQEISLSKDNIQEAHFSMYCFWSGEAFFGNQDGVIKTTAGFMDGKEIIKVIYDDSKTSIDILKTKAEKESISYIRNPGKFLKDKDPKYYLKKSIYKYLAMNELQATKINSALANGRDASLYLSPSQKLFLLKFLKNELDGKLIVLYDKELHEAWKKMKL